MTDYHTTVLDRPGLLRLFRHLAGRRLVGAVDGIDCVELVFEPDEHDGNLVTIFTEGRERGWVAFGFVARELVEAGYGSDKQELEW